MLSAQRAIVASRDTKQVTGACATGVTRGKANSQAADELLKRKLEI